MEDAPVPRFHTVVAATNHICAESEMPHSARPADEPDKAAYSAPTPDVGAPAIFCDFSNAHRTRDHAIPQIAAVCVFRFLTST